MFLQRQFRRALQCAARAPPRLDCQKRGPLHQGPLHQQQRLGMLVRRWCSQCWLRAQTLGVMYCCNRRRRFQGNDSCLQILITTIFERSRRWCLALLQSESTWTIVVPCHDMAGQDWVRKTTCSTSSFLCNGNYPILWFPLALSKNPSLHTFIRSWEWAWVSCEILKSLLTWAFMFVVAINWIHKLPYSWQRILKNFLGDTSLCNTLAMTYRPIDRFQLADYWRRSFKRSSA